MLFEHPYLTKVFINASDNSPEGPLLQAFFENLAGVAWCPGD
jgi:hypothetical protein